MSGSIQAACYARYSTDKQNPLSIDDQIAKLREFADRQGWEIDAGRVYADEEISGATTERPGLQSLLEAAESQARPFDALLVEDTSRLSRKQADVLNLCERLTFAGVRIVFVGQGIDSTDPQFQLMLSTRGLIDQLFLTDTAKRVRRGMEGLVRRGLHTGGRVFGYRARRDDDGTRLEVNEDEAAIIRRIFNEYGSGRSLKQVARMLNVEAVPSPQPRKGRQRSWSPTAVGHILHNLRYVGKIVWNVKRKVRNPRTGRRVHRHNPAADVIRADAPHLRIVTDEQWNRVNDRFEEVRRFVPKTRAGLIRDWNVVGSPYLLSGLLRCGTCGANVTFVSGEGKHSHARYGCPNHHLRGTCENGVTERREVLERRILIGLQDEVLREEVVEYTIEKSQQELQAKRGEMSSELGSLRRRRDELEGEIGRLTEALATGTGGVSLAIVDAIRDRERQLKVISEKLLASTPDSLDARSSEIREFVIAGLADIHKLLSAELLDVAAAKQELRKHLQDKITLVPQQNGGKRFFLAQGEWDLVGGHRRIKADGAGGRNRTAYASLFRAALYQ